MPPTASRFGDGDATGDENESRSVAASIGLQRESEAKPDSKNGFFLQTCRRASVRPRVPAPATRRARGARRRRGAPRLAPFRGWRRGTEGETPHTALIRHFGT